MSVIHGSNYGTPAVDLDFSVKKSLTDRVSGNLVSFTRNSIGTYVNENGVIQSAASGEARFDHDPVTGESLGLLVEEERINWLSHSQNVILGNDGTVRPSLTNISGFLPNAAIAPDGTLTAYEADFSQSYASLGVPVNIFSVVSGTSYTASVWVKKVPGVTYQNLSLVVNGWASPEIVSFNSTLNASSGWIRVSATFTSTVTGSREIHLIRQQSGSNVSSQPLYFWGPQVETGSFPTSYIPTPATFTSRASIATYYDANGVIQTAAIDVARDNVYFPDENGVFKPAGLLLEESRANLFDYSVDVSQWTGANWTATPNSITAPDGTLTGGKVVPIVGTIFQTIGRSITWTSGVTYSVSFFAKDAGMGAVQIHCFNQINRGEFDLVNGTSSIVTTGLSTSITPFPNGWYKCVYIFTAGSTTTGLAGLRIPSGFTPDGVEGIYAWGFQVEASVFSSSYIPTSGSTFTRAADLSSSSTVTRSAEVVSLSNTNLFDPTEDFTYVNKPFGTSSGSSTINFNGPTIKRTTIYPSNLSRVKLDKATSKTDEFWQWRILGSSFGLPSFVTDGQVTVDWGDGTVETLTTSDHTFTDGGGYHEVGFRLDSGTYFRPYINNNASHDTKVVAVGPAPAGMRLDALSSFYGCSNLEAFDATVDVTGGTNFSNAWRNCSSLTSFPLIDTSSGIIFTQAWRGCNSLTSFPLIDTSSVTNFSSAWYLCSSLTSFPLIDTSSGTNFTSAWNGCNSLTSFPLIDTSSGTNFANAWYNCSSLTSFPLLDTSSGTNFNSAWRQCSSLTSFPLIDTSSGTNFYRAWRQCSSLTSFPLIDTSSGTDFRESWYLCSSLIGFPLIDTSSGTNFYRAWYGCSSLTSFPLIDTSSGTNFSEAWLNCSSLISFPLIDTSSGTNFIYAWQGCSSLTSFPALDTSSATNLVRAWYGCSSLTSFPLLNVSKVTGFGDNFQGAWHSCTSLTDFPAGFFDNWGSDPSWTGVADNCFNKTWDNCTSLTATSVENILNSIDTSGQSAPASGVDITIDYDAGTGTPSVSTAVTNLKSRGWTITLNGVAQ